MMQLSILGFIQNMFLQLDIYVIQLIRHNTPAYLALYYSTFESLQCYIRDYVNFAVIFLGDSKPFTTTYYTNKATTVCLMVVYSSTSGT